MVVPEGETAGTHFPDPAGQLVIDLHDTDNDDIKGSFSFEAKKTGSTEVYNVTDGAFDFDGEFYSE